MIILAEGGNAGQRIVLDCYLWYNQEKEPFQNNKEEIL